MRRKIVDSFETSKIVKCWRIALMAWTPMLSLSADGSASVWFIQDVNCWQLFINGGAEIERQIVSMNFNFGYRPENWMAQNWLIVHQNASLKLPSLVMFGIPSPDKARDFTWGSSLRNGNLLGAADAVGGYTILGFSPQELRYSPSNYCYSISNLKVELHPQVFTIRDGCLLDTHLNH